AGPDCGPLLTCVSCLDFCSTESVAQLVKLKRSELRLIHQVRAIKSPGPPAGDDQRRHHCGATAGGRKARPDGDDVKGILTLANSLPSYIISKGTINSVTG